MDTATQPRYYTPSAQPSYRHRPEERHAETIAAARPQPAYGRDGPPGLPSGVSVATTCHNIVVCTAASGGIGLSALAAIVSRRLAERELPCALVDVDFGAGGIDVLLGIEGESGTRFESLDAPLGQIDGKALGRDLPVWNGVHVLASNPWNGAAPDWWQTQAAIRALADTNRAVVVDAGRGELIDTMPELGAAAQLVLAELSVLGLARAKRHIRRLQQGANIEADDARGERDVGRRRMMVVGAQPHGTSRLADAVSLDDAEEYLGVPVAGCVRANPKLCSDVLSGLGIGALNRSGRRVADGICDWIDGLLAGASS
ncbi:hypothetical protein [Bifidobacterium sp. SO1]|uniref:hypothetical protein n=1 Tax=Bifidobacterium sp. SO1 TaxID=2809029 RepID=UPI001BDBDBCA|nr:hypothetical protein [Bifidobacterium sp. SO1]MBT1162003.1 hypothetical protein [Bifidobacterium sp. SO1]